MHRNPVRTLGLPIFWFLPPHRPYKSSKEDDKPHHTHDNSDYSCNREGLGGCTLARDGVSTLQGDHRRGFLWGKFLLRDTLFIQSDIECKCQALPGYPVNRYQNHVAVQGGAGSTQSQHSTSTSLL